MLLPSKMNETAKVHHAQFLKEMKVPEIMQRQVPMIQEQQEDEALKRNKAEAQLNRVGSNADTGSSERRRTPHRSSQESRKPQHRAKHFERRECRQRGSSR